MTEVTEATIKDAKKKNTIPKPKLPPDITLIPTIGNMSWELSEINNLVEVVGLLELSEPLKAFGPWPEMVRLTFLNKCWSIAPKEIVTEDGPMMVLTPLLLKEEMLLNQIILTQLQMATPANLLLLLSAFLATISSMFIMKALILLPTASTTTDPMSFTFMSTTTGVITLTESLMIPTAQPLLITMPLSM